MISGEQGVDLPRGEGDGERTLPDGERGAGGLDELAQGLAAAEGAGEERAERGLERGIEVGLEARAREPHLGVLPGEHVEDRPRGRATARSGPKRHGVYRVSAARRRRAGRRGGLAEEVVNASPPAAGPG